MTCILKFVNFLQRNMKSTIHKMSHISKTTHAISMNFSMNVIHDISTQKMQKGENIVSLIWTHFLSHGQIY
jgi:hypothetical protein